MSLINDNSVRYSRNASAADVFDGAGPGSHRERTEDNNIYRVCVEIYRLEKVFLSDIRRNELCACVITVYNITRPCSYAHIVCVCFNKVYRWVNRTYLRHIYDQKPGVGITRSNIIFFYSVVG